MSQGRRDWSRTADIAGRDCGDETRWKTLATAIRGAGLGDGVDLSFQTSRAKLIVDGLVGGDDVWAFGAVRRGVSLGDGLDVVVVPGHGGDRAVRQPVWAGSGHVPWGTASGGEGRRGSEGEES